MKYVGLLLATVATDIVILLIIRQYFGYTIVMWKSVADAVVNTLICVMVMYFYKFCFKVW